MPPNSVIDKYACEIEKVLASGVATEHSYRAALERLLEGLAPELDAINEPQRVACGAPDFVVARATTHGLRSVGYVEAKDVGTFLGRTARSKQLRRYRDALHNLVLTDHLEFRWFIDGEQRGAASLGEPDGSGHIKISEAAAKSVRDLLLGFLTHSPQPVATPRDLAERMARLSHFIRDIVITSFDGGNAPEVVRDMREAFSEVLIADLSLPEFADMFSQTLAYGLFAARVNHRSEEPFRRAHAAAEIPRTNPFLRRLFTALAGPDLDDAPFAGFVDDLAQLLAETDMESVLSDFGKVAAKEDPIEHFYETFLAAYDPAVRDRRGVFYTPQPVVSYIVRSVDWVLKNRFGCAKGLADSAVGEGGGISAAEGSPEPVLILDPACGTGTFLSRVVSEIRDDFMEQGNAGMWAAYVKEELLPRLYGFELLMAPYAVAHLRLSLQLAGADLPPEQQKDWSYDFAGDDRLGVYLTNTLEEPTRRDDLLIGRYISDEANAAAAIKREQPVMVVLGNPPYEVRSQNRGEWILDLLDDYKIGLGERKLNLDDDFIKFFRFAQWRIEQTGQGVLAFISNRTYIEGLTHRRMRESLLGTFDEIYILDLHGGHFKDRSGIPDDDANVFDIRQGVAIGIFVKRAEPGDEPRVFKSDLVGPRKDKYAYLSENDVGSTEWAEVEDVDRETDLGRFFFFTDASYDHLDDYAAGWSIGEIFKVGSSAIETKRNALFISTSRDELQERFQHLAEDGITPLARERFDLPEQGGLSEQLGSLTFDAGAIRPYEFRPFDSRFIYFDPELLGRARLPVMKHMLQPNIGISTLRQTVDDGFRHVFVSRHLLDRNLLINHHVSDRFFPLYLYEESDEGALPDFDEAVNGGTRTPNISPEFITDLEAVSGLHFVQEGHGDLAKTIGPEDVLAYIYSVLHSPTYRLRYEELLRLGLPRVPLIDDLDALRGAVRIGSELVETHAVTGPVESGGVTFPIPGDNVVRSGFPKYVAPGEIPSGATEPVETGRVYINGEENNGQYFDGIDPSIWEAKIGTYQAAKNWLTYRRDAPLSLQQLKFFQEMVGRLTLTGELSARVDDELEDQLFRDG